MLDRNRNSFSTRSSLVEDFSIHLQESVECVLARVFDGWMFKEFPWKVFFLLKFLLDLITFDERREEGNRYYDIIAQ